MSTPVKFSRATALSNIGGPFYKTSILTKTGYKVSTDVLDKILKKKTEQSTESYWDFFSQDKLKGFPKSSLMMALALECSYVVWCTQKEDMRADVVKVICENVDIGLDTIEKTQFFIAALAFFSYVLVALERNINKHGEAAMSQKKMDDFFCKTFGIELQTIPEQYEAAKKLLTSAQAFFSPNSVISNTVDVGVEKVKNAVLKLMITIYRRCSELVRKTNDGMVFSDVYLHNGQIKGTHNVIFTGWKIGLDYLKTEDPELKSLQAKGIIMGGRFIATPI